MPDCKITIELDSAFITPLQADTLFGHICWALLYMEGESELKKFLEIYTTSPPFLTSDAFPEGYLPRPILPPLSVHDMEQIEEGFCKTNGKVDKVKKFHLLKYLKKWKKDFIIQAETLNIIRKNYTEKTLIVKMLKGELQSPHFEMVKHEKCKPVDLTEDPDKKDKTKNTHYLSKSEEISIVAHNTIDRISNTVAGDGGYYQQEETFYRPGTRREIYIHDEYFSEIRLKELLKYIGDAGYGKDASVGKGHFSIKNIEAVEWYSLTDANAIMLLSSCVPSENNPTKGWYKLQTKYGKVGSVFSQTGNEGAEHPFKKPLLQISNGSVFFCNPPIMYMGKMVRNIHVQPYIVHYGYAITFPLCIQ